MATTPTFPAFADGTPASRRWNPAMPGRGAAWWTIGWGGPVTGGIRPSPRPVDARGPWAGVVASRLHRAALAQRLAA